MNEDGTMARVPDLVPYCEHHGLRMITVADLVEYRRRHEKLVERRAAVPPPTDHREVLAGPVPGALTQKKHPAPRCGAVGGAGKSPLPGDPPRLPRRRVPSPTF